MSCVPGEHEHIPTKYCPDCGELLRPDPIRIDHLHQLREVAEVLEVGGDWHEPDSVNVTARVWGHSFDNAGFWPVDPSQPQYPCTPSLDSPGLEMYVELIKAGKVIAQVNLATLFAMACRTYE